MIDLLYREEDPTGRELGYKVFKAISGKDPNYKPDSSKEARIKSMQLVWEVWYSVRDQIEREDAKKGKEK